MARLPYVDPATASEDVRTLLERLPVRLNVFRMMAHAENDFRPLVGLGTAILGRQKLSPKLRELAILRVAGIPGVFISLPIVAVATVIYRHIRHFRFNL